MNESIFSQCRQAAALLAMQPEDKINSTLAALADAVEARADQLLEANAADCSALDAADPRHDRLLLTPARIKEIADGIRTVANLPSPLGTTLETIKRPNGLTIRKVSVPFGVIGSIFEARPNVVFDIFSLCFKAGSAAGLKGGHEADATNTAAAEIIHSVLEAAGLPSALALMPSDHDAATAMLRARGMIDLIIPRGSRRLIDFVRDNATVPVIETGAGVCHTYFHSSGDIATGRDIILNAKTRRPAVCNSLDCLIVDRSRLTDLPAICYPLAEKNVTIHADAEAYDALEGAYPLLTEAGECDAGREWLSLDLAIFTVENIDEAIEFISRYGSQHSECIIAENSEASRMFLARVDAACVYANVSTAFTDGAQFGFGAEIGISTQKLHARGPMALREITTYKYLITGAGQTRS